MRCQLCGKEIFGDNIFCEDCQRKREEYLERNSNSLMPSSNQNITNLIVHQIIMMII